MTWMYVFYSPLPNPVHNVNSWSDDRNKNKTFSFYRLS